VSELVSDGVSEYINDSYVNKHKNKSVNVNINVLWKNQHLFISAYTFTKYNFTESKVLFHGGNRRNKNFNENQFTKCEVLRHI
jgi:hypothetical protein